MTNFIPKFSVNSHLSLNNSDQNVIRNKKLFTGLRINGQISMTRAINTIDISLNKSKIYDSGHNNTETIVSTLNNPSNSFFAEMSSRFKDQNSDSESAALFAESLRETADTIRHKFGQDKANKFMSKILAATDSKINENSLSSAISGFFKDLKADTTISNDTLEDMRAILNQGLSSSEQNSSVPAGLGYMLKTFFGDTNTFSAGNEHKIFNTDFERVLLSEIEKSGSDASLEPAITLKMEKHFDNTYLANSSVSNKVAEYLRNELGNENAASYIESLRLDANYMVGLATACGIVANESGQNAVAGFISFLNDEIKGYLSGSQEEVSVVSINLGPNFSDENERKASGFNFGQNGIPIEHPSLNKSVNLNKVESPSSMTIPPDAFTGALVTQDMFDKQHQGLTILLDGKAKNTSGQGFELDITALYQEYQAHFKSTSTSSLENPRGNLVNKLI